MTTSSSLLPASQVLAEVDALLDRVAPREHRMDPADRLALVRLARRVRSRVDALASVVTAEAERAHAAERAAGTGLGSWIGMGETVSRREAAGAVRQARSLGSHPVVGEAAVAGRLGTGQVRAITGLLDGLAPQLSGEQAAQAEELLVGWAGQMDADQLTRSAGKVLAAVAPATAAETMEARLQREAEAAHRQRSLRFFFEGASVRFDGSLPRLAAEAWIAQLDAMAEQTRRTLLERRDRLAELPTADQRRADALIALIQAGGKGKESWGGRVLVQLDYAQLLAGAAGVGLVGAGQQLPAGELRRICCDAELIPVVLGSHSEVLDVGRAERLVTPAIRTALLVRDRGCVFPGCDAPASRCEAHHIIPWWAGGRTSLSNLALLCHTHHPLVEPAHGPLRDQWQLRIAPDGLPEFTPPARIDPNQKPVRHSRHTRHTADSPPTPATGPPPAA
ncbi:HNH endonuclease [Propionicimonas paludicola]|uniref:HNH endonuclease n=1 Tax=Propionicimonas paludicola TaxID=185243 RepID=A0A2A9CTZ5_9ACTN|nr:HNH endonuclease signature motif containing protein [Propionicimonas paludicola]PFG17913.1 HNH endonuclease [Propionicimonas paludicola]